jgi:hypothetical protein
MFPPFVFEGARDLLHPSMHPGRHGFDTTIRL